ncbi:uncharacterized protein [Parasteatoda tepidariorum]|uniref:uncharacterized protein n=1 Tax=Parasteatoda tepidariorum TaxID=114398 RepID=UPI00077FD21A|nr:uncharacterized protein LOC107448096 [Parasteatoda tepidariorum]
MIRLQKFCVACWLFVIFLKATEATDSVSKPNDQSERKARAWLHHAHPGPPMLLQQHQQAPVSTSLPIDAALQQNSNPHQPSDPNGLNRNYEDPDKSAMPAASEQDFLSRHFGYLNVHRFDPNFPYYDRNVFPRFPSPQLSPHTPRFGPGYRKDKYGHGYGYSCKQGDDCDEVRAANQLAAAQPPPHMTHPHPHNPGLPFGNNYPELSPYPSLPSFQGMSSFSPYGGQFGPAPARFNDPQGPPPMMPSMYPGGPSRFYQGRYLHDEEPNNKGTPVNNNNQEAPVNNPFKGLPVNGNQKSVPVNNNYKGIQQSRKIQGGPEDSQKTIDERR